LIKARVGRVVVAVADPNPKVAGQGIERMNAAGISVEVGVLADQANEVLAPYLKRTQANVPWVLAKWAMTVDGKIASASGSSKWISSERSRERVHQLRRRCDAVVVGIGTALADDPMLNPRPAGERSVLRVVVDSKARIAIDSKLVATATDYRTLIAVGPEASQIKIDDLERLNCEVWQCTLPDANERLSQLLQYLAKNDCTNILVEGGGRLLGALNDLEQIDEAHVFVGPKLLGGGDAISPVAGIGQSAMTAASGLSLQNVQRIDNDIYAIYRKKRVQTIAQG
jgi:diaminohydroxyphosphoribosylaminopyrimidine deaminase/5-amino-6-(5-phosphoribosylamino)uracil reductase